MRLLGYRLRLPYLNNRPASFLVQPIWRSIICSQRRGWYQMLEITLSWPVIILHWRSNVASLKTGRICYHRACIWAVYQITAKTCAAVASGTNVVTVTDRFIQVQWIFQPDLQQEVNKSGRYRNASVWSQADEGMTIFDGYLGESQLPWDVGHRRSLTAKLQKSRASW